jgi:putative transposase
MKKTDKRFESIAHAKTRLRYHIIFSTKYRRKCLGIIKEDIFNAFNYVEEKSDFKILVMNLEDDHIHFLLKIKPALSIEQVVRRMKQLSTWYLWQHNRDYLNKYYWSKKKIWTGGYFASTIGEVSEEKILEYINNQG